MFCRTLVRLGLCVAVVLGFSVLLGNGTGGEADKVKTPYYKGKVVPLAGILEKQGVKISVIKSRLLRARRRLVSLFDARGVTMAKCSFSSKFSVPRISQDRLHLNPKGAIYCK